MNISRTVAQLFSCCKHPSSAAAIRQRNFPEIRWFSITRSEKSIIGRGIGGGGKKRLHKHFQRRNVAERLDTPSAEFAPEESQSYFFKDRPLKDLWKALAFALGFSGCCFVAAPIWQYERRKRGNREFFNWGYTMRKQGVWREKTPLGSGLPATLHGLYIFSDQTSTWAGIEKLCSPMLLSVFSHYSYVHFGLNMFVLWSFGAPVIDRFLGVEQFSSLYLSAENNPRLNFLQEAAQHAHARWREVMGHWMDGVLAALVGLAHKATTRSFGAALGASGAILGLLTYSCLKLPDARLSIIFLPFFTFPASTAVYGIIAFDALGLLLKWRIFDHAAHLGGSLFGV